ncbi:MAG: helix-turn-helix domain-containing protein [Pseudonocardiaceae bacterium]
MAETFGHVLRSVREAAGLSLASLAARTNYHKSEIGYVETGKRRASVDLATACDHVLGTFPLLSTVVEMDEEQGDQVKRRALLEIITATVGTFGIGSASTLANIVRHGLLDSVDAAEDWDAVVEDFSRQSLTDRSPAYGEALLAQLMVARQQNVNLGATADRMRAAAQLSQIYGLWLGNRGDVASARGWYRSAAMVADRSGDSLTRIFVRGRALSRGIYESYTARETIEGVEAALDITRKPCLGALEAYSALVHVHGLTDDLRSGRTAVDNMQRVTDQLPDSETRKVAGPVERTTLFRNYLECRVGSRRDADRAFTEADPMLRLVPAWHADAKVYYARALAKDGDVADGVDLALEAAKGFGQDVRTIRVGVRDVLSVIPKGYHSDQLEELKLYAAVGPTPWETIS